MPLFSHHSTGLHQAHHTRNIQVKFFPQSPFPRWVHPGHTQLPCDACCPPELDSLATFIKPATPSTSKLHPYFCPQPLPTIYHGAYPATLRRALPRVPLSSPRLPLEACSTRNIQLQPDGKRPAEEHNQQEPGQYGTFRAELFHDNKSWVS